MTDSAFGGIGRRGFLRTAGGLMAGTAWAALARADDRPPVTVPRATSGDEAVEPNWDERLTVTVGPDKAQLVGTDDKVLQAAVDYVSRYGGGTVRILPGTYKLRNAVWLNSKVRLVGSGSDSILIKEPSQSVKLSFDSDWYDQEVTLADGKGFQVGDGVCLRAKNPHNGGAIVIKRTLTARSGNRFKLDKALRENLWLMSDATASSLFPLITAEYASNLVIENLVLDGNRENNERLDGNYAGCIFLQDCRQVAIRGVEARNYHGDGVSWQICHDVTVENCHSHDNSDLGLHPGSGSQRPLIRNNKLERNNIGIFFCWGVKYGLAEKNLCFANRDYGISIGHRDTDNLIRDNDIRLSGKVGVLFRPERGQAFAPHRNRLENNRIIDSGPAEGIAVDVQGQTEAVTIANNDIRETRQAMQRVGIRLGADTRDIKLVDNHIEGFAKDISNAPGKS